jgi:hypothetical protein
MLILSFFTVTECEKYTNAKKKKMIKQLHVALHVIHFLKFDLNNIIKDLFTEVFFTSITRSAMHLGSQFSKKNAFCT